jgi:outer membrane protein assembly factor BamB
MITIIKSTLLCALTLTVSTFAADGGKHWPQWRGPLLTGAAPDANPPIEWSEEKGVKWKVKLPGRGTSTPVIWEDTIFIHTAIPTGKKVVAIPAEVASGVPAAQVQQPGQGERRRRGPGGPGGGRGGEEAPKEEHEFVLMALNRADGKVKWQKAARQEVPHEGHHPDHGFSSASPLTDGQHVFAYFGSRGLHAFDMQGNLKWSKDLGRMQTRNGFGEGSSPALHENVLVVNWDHEGEDFVAAFDKATGRELWRNKRDEPTSWSTPLILEHGGKAQAIVSATQRIRSYDLQTGQQIWECGGMTVNAIPTPVADKEKVYIMSGFRGNKVLAIKLGRTGDLTGTDAIAWSHDKSTPYVPSPLLYQDKLWFFSDRVNIVSCFDTQTGKPHYEAQRVEGLQGVYASPVAARDRVYLVGRNGVTAVVKASDRYEVLATNKLDERFDASPALVGNEMYLRGHEHLYCLAQ